MRIIRVVRFAAKLGFEHRAGHRSADRARWRALLANVPMSRLFDEMVKLLQTGHALASIERAAQAGPATAASSRCSTRCWRRRSRNPRARDVRAPGARRTPTAASPKAAPWRRASCWPACCGTTCWSAGARCERGGERAVPGAAAGGRCGVRRPHRRHLGPRQAGRRHARDLADAAALRAPHGQLGAALVEQPRFRAGYDFLRLRADCGEVRGRTGRLVGGLPPRRRRRARGAAAGPARARPPKRRVPRPRRAARRRPGAAAQPRRPRRAEGRRGADARAGAGGAAGAASAAGGGASRRRRARRQRRRRRRRAADDGRDAPPSAPSSAWAPTSAMRGPRWRRRCARWPRCRSTRLVAVSSLYRSAPVDATGPGLRQRRGRAATPRWRRATLLRALQAIEQRSRPRARRTATRRARSTSTCCCTASAAIDEPGLTVPHPRLHERAFVLRPLAELAPDADAARAWGRCAPGCGALRDQAHRAASSRGLTRRGRRSPAGRWPHLQSRRRA